jgi:hypothetical protein
MFHVTLLCPETYETYETFETIAIVTVLIFKKGV